MFLSASNYISRSAESYSACILGLGNALGIWPQAFLGSRMQPRTSFCRVSYLLHVDTASSFGMPESWLDRMWPDCFLAISNRVSLPRTAAAPNPPLLPVSPSCGCLAGQGKRAGRTSMHDLPGWQSGHQDRRTVMRHKGIQDTAGDEGRKPCNYGSSLPGDACLWACCRVFCATSDAAKDRCTAADANRQNS